MMISELLEEGRANAITGRELAEYCGCNIRDITLKIERERRQGLPICASTGENPGYYLAADEHELQLYCDSLDRRAGELDETRQSMGRILKTLQEGQANGEQKSGK